MSERERWIVYPLLFLSLGVSLRDKLSNRTWSENVLCERLVLIDGSRGPLSEPPVMGWMGPTESGRVPTPPGGQLSVGVIRAGTIIADNYTSPRGFPFSLRDLLGALGRSTDDRNTSIPLPEPPDTADASPEADAQPKASPPADADESRPPATNNDP
jgi:hypothetical protein